MGHRQGSKLRGAELSLVAIVAAMALSGALADAAAATPQVTPGVSPTVPEATRFASVRQICPAARRGDASCLALALVPAAEGSPGAHAYLLSAGSLSTGPAGGLTPSDLASAYGYTPTLGGSGQTVAIVDAFDDPKLEEDLGAFDSHYGLAACTAIDGCLQRVNQEGKAAPLPAADKVGWSVETSLDVETVHSVCPACKIVLVEARSESLADLASAVNEAVALGAGEVSNSYGAREYEMGSAEQAAYDHPGTVIAAAAGDSRLPRLGRRRRILRGAGSGGRSRLASERRCGRRDVAEARRQRRAAEREGVERQRTAVAGSRIQTVRRHRRRVQLALHRTLVAAGGGRLVEHGLRDEPTRQRHLRRGRPVHRIRHL